MQKKIVLIWAFRSRKDEDPATPLWAFSLGAYLKKKNPYVEIYVLDEQIIGPSVILKKIIDIKPDVVGISLSYEYYVDALRFARKSKLIGAKVVFGGAYATALKKEILKNRGPYSDDYCIDAVIQGDGEKAFHEYITGKPLNKIDNFVYQTKKEIIENTLVFLDLDKIPSPDRSLVNLDKYFQGSKFIGSRWLKHLSAYYQKGCWWREKTGGCIFCSHSEKFLRLRDPKFFAEELKELIFKYPIDSIRIHGEEFFSDIHWVEDFKKYYEKYISEKVFVGKRMPFLTISTRADRINVKNIKILKKINTRNIFIGFESGDQRCLNALRKGISLAIIRKAANLLNKYQIYILGSFIFGSPGETKKTLQKTLCLIKDLSLLNYMHWIRIQPFTPLPGSLSWQMLINKTGLKYKDKDLIPWVEVRKDWIKHFCDFTTEDIINMKREFRQLARKHKNIRFSFFNIFGKAEF